MDNENAKRPTTKRLPNDEIGELKKLFKESQEQLRNLQLKIEENEPRYRRESAKQDDYIEVISLCPNMITLTTEQKGRGFPYTWTNFGDISQIVYSDLQRLIKNHGSGLYTDFFREGYLYINDKDVVKKSGFNAIYDKILNLDQMKEILLCNSEECVKLFKSTNRTQQLFICDMLIKNIADGAELDLNIVDKLGRVVGVKIADHAEEAIEYAKLWGKRE